MQLFKHLKIGLNVFLFVCSILFVSIRAVSASAETYSDRDVVIINSGETKQIVLEAAELNSSEVQRGVYIQFTAESKSIVSYTIKANSSSFRTFGYDDLDFIGDNYETEESREFEVEAGTNKILICERAIGGTYWYGEGFDIEVSLTIKEETISSNKEDDVKKEDTVVFERIGKSKIKLADWSDTYKLKYKLSNTSLTLKWKSSNNQIAKVSKHGEVDANKLGIAYITATIKETGQQIKWQIIVNRASHYGKSSNGDTYIGDKESIKSEIKHIKNWKKIKWKSSDQKKVTIKKQTITAKKKGTVILSGKSEGITYKLEVVCKKKTEKENQWEKLKKASKKALNHHFPAGVYYINYEKKGKKLYTHFWGLANYNDTAKEHCLLAWYENGKIKTRLVY